MNNKNIGASFQNLIFKLRELVRKLFDKLPNRYQWSHFFKVLGKREYHLLLFFIFLFFGSFIFLTSQWYIKTTEIKPAVAGKYTEGIIGYPRFINPVLSSANDADRDLTQLIFSSLMKYDEKGNLIPDLAEKYSILENNKVYEITLKKNIKWHDKKSLDADDVLFTIQLIQNVDYKSPLRINWLGVEIEKVNDLTIRLKLKNPYAPFLHNLTFGILPKHIWKDISVANFSLSAYNLNPIGAGPYQITNLSKDKKTGVVKSLDLESYKNYHFGEPFVKFIKLKFYKDEGLAAEAFNKNEIDGFGFSSIKNLSKIKFPTLTNVYSFKLPRYFAVFFNQEKNKALNEKSVRLALSYATNKKEIIEKVLNGNGIIIDSPILPNLFGYNIETKKYDFDLEAAKNLLETNNWKDTDQDGIREKEFALDKKNKEKVKLEITLLTTQRPELIEIANLLKEQWGKIGVKASVDIKEIFDLQQNYIKPRQYQALLFGEVLGIDPDPFSFWHSSQKRDPGLNLALYDNREADKLLEEERQESNPEIRIQKYTKFQNLVVDDVPVIFLYSPLYFYAASKNIKGIEGALMATPSNRFNQIENWYIKTKRAWK